MTDHLKELAEEVKLDYDFFIDHRVQSKGRHTRINLGNLQLKRLPSSLAHIDQISTLDCHYNNLRELPEFLADMNLQKLDASSNDLQNIPDVICRNKHLREVKLRENQIKRVMLSPDDAPNLLRLNLSVNPLVDCKIYHHQLRDINLSYGKLKELQLDTPSLRILRINENQFTHFPNINTPDLMIINVGDSELIHIDEGTLPIANLTECILYLPTIEPLFPHILKELIEVPKVHLQFDTSTQEEIDHIVEKVKVFCRIAGYTVKQIQGTVEKLPDSNFTRYQVEWLIRK